MHKTRLLLLIVLFLQSLLTVRAQSNWEAGVRFGDGFALDATVPLSMEPRLHAAAYFGNDFGVGAYFNWMFALDQAPEGLKFYPGVGPEVYFGNDFAVAVAGDFGAEYSFEFPLTVGIDWRPRVQFSDNTGFYGGNWGLIARYRFGDGIHFHRAKK